MKSKINSPTINKITIPLVAIFLSLLIGAVIMLASGSNPVTGFLALFKGMVGGSYRIGETLQTMTPLILAGLAVAFAYKTGLFNSGLRTINPWLVNFCLRRYFFLIYQ